MILFKLNTRMHSGVELNQYWNIYKAKTNAFILLASHQNLRLHVKQMCYETADLTLVAKTFNFYPADNLFPSVTYNKRNSAYSHFFFFYCSSTSSTVKKKLQ